MSTSVLVDDASTGTHAFRSQTLSGAARDVSALAAPLVAQSLLHTLVFLVDRAMLGHFSRSALASMQISGPLVWTSYSILGSFAIGTLAVVGRAIGAGRPRDAVAAVRAGLFLAIVCGGVASAVSLGSLPWMATFFPEASDAVRGDATAFLRIVLPALPFILVSIAGSAALQAAGDTRTPFLIVVGSNIVNFALAYVLIFGELGAPRLGVSGAAIGTATACVIEAVATFAVLSRARSKATFRGSIDHGAVWDAARRTMRVGGPVYLERLAQHAGFLTFVALIASLGDTAMGANQALIAIESICFLTVDAFGTASASLVARHLGAHDANGAKRIALSATLLAVGLLAVFALVFAAIPETLVRAFNDDAVLIAAATPVLYVAAIAQPFMATSIVLAETMRGAGATKSTLVVVLVCGVLVRVFAAHHLGTVLGLGLAGLWLGSTVDWVVRTVLLGWLFQRGTWAKIEV